MERGHGPVWYFQWKIEGCAWSLVRDEARMWGWVSGWKPCAKVTVRCATEIKVTNPNLVRKVKRIYAIISARSETQNF